MSKYLTREEVETIKEEVNDEHVFARLGLKCVSFGDLFETLLAYMDIAETLRLVLPLARGYAAEHRVGSNFDYINSAEAALEKVGGGE